MTTRYSKLTREFKAKNAAGQERTILVYTEYVQTGAFQSPTQDVEGLNDVRTSSGEVVNVLEKGKYQVVQTGEILTSADPNAL